MLLKTSFRIIVHEKETFAGAVVAIVTQVLGDTVGELPGLTAMAPPAKNPSYLGEINALAPAEVSKVVMDEEDERVEVVVPDEQLSLAIGKRGRTSASQRSSSVGTSTSAARKRSNAKLPSRWVPSLLLAKRFRSQLLKALLPPRLKHSQSMALAISTHWPEQTLTTWLNFLT